MSTLPPLQQALVDAGFRKNIVLEDGGLFQRMDYVSFGPRSCSVSLDGEFTVSQLKALVAWMEVSQRVATANTLDALRQESMGQKVSAVFAAEPPYTIEELTK